MFALRNVWISGGKYKPRKQGVKQERKIKSEDEEEKGPESKEGKTNEVESKDEETKREEKEAPGIDDLDEDAAFTVPIGMGVGPSFKHDYSELGGTILHVWRYDSSCRSRCLFFNDMHQCQSACVCTYYFTTAWHVDKAKKWCVVRRKRFSESWEHRREKRCDTVGSVAVWLKFPCVVCPIHGSEDLFVEKSETASTGSLVICLLDIMTIATTTISCQRGSEPHRLKKGYTKFAILSMLRLAQEAFIAYRDLRPLGTVGEYPAPPADPTLTEDYSFVRLATRRDGLKSSVKMVKREHISKRERRRLRKEARLLHEMNNLHIIKLHGYYEESDAFYMAVEYCDGKSKATLDVVRPMHRFIFASAFY